MNDYPEGNGGGQKQAAWLCIRQRAGPLVKECRNDPARCGLERKQS